MKSTRRKFLQSVAATGAGGVLGAKAHRCFAASDSANGQSAEQLEYQVVHPRERVPLSFIIDDSTCLVNMGHFCMPQFAAAWPERDIYKKPWKDWPREIPDSFVREFGEWCADHGVKGKYSIVPYPACVGWLDRELPGWSRAELLDSLKLVRELMVPNWDIHPEMITHTRVIDLKTGRPLEAINAGTMENSYPQEKKSVDELAEYLAYALRVLKQCDLPCEGVTTPGGFGNMVKSELGLAAFQAVREVYGTEIPHYFKYVKSGDESTEPVLEHVSPNGTGIDLIVNVPAGTGDWFGGWDGVRDVEGHRYSNEDATEGRMVELIERGDPAVMLCHWPGLYNNGTKAGLHQFQMVVTALNKRFGDQTQWMKLSEMARYWAAKELVEMRLQDEKIMLDAPVGCRDFTFRLPVRIEGRPTYAPRGRHHYIERVENAKDLAEMKWRQDGDECVICIPLAKGQSEIAVN